MKNLVKYLSVVFLLFSDSIYVFTNPYPNAEFFVINKLSNPVNLYIKLYPVGSIFTGYKRIPDPPYYIPPYYSLQEKLFSELGISRRGNPANYPLKFLIGLDGYALANRPGGDYSDYFEITPDDETHPDRWCVIGQDDSQGSMLDGLIGYGKYVLEIYKSVGQNPPTFTRICDPINIDWLDFNYGEHNPNSQHYKDLWIKIYTLDPLSIKFLWSAPPPGGADGVEIPVFGAPCYGTLKVYDQYIKFEYGEWVHTNLTPSKGNSYSDYRDDDNGKYRKYPLEGTNTALLPSPFTIPYHEAPSILNANLNIEANKIAYVKCGKTLEVSNNSALHLRGTLQSNRALFYIGDQVNNPTCLAKLIIDGGSNLILAPYTQLWAEQNSWLHLKKNSGVTLNAYSTLTMKSYSIFCNEGATIQRNGGVLVLQGNVRRCYIYPNDNIVKDSAQIIVDTNAVWELDDSTTYTFEGNVTALICKEGSSIQFGKGSKLIFKDGARLKANDVKFTSFDSTQTWDGIYLSGISYDTLKNCIIENAYNGINIEDKTSLYDPVATEISGCTFKNTTTTDLLNYVYINNSTNILIKNCNSGVTSSGKFTSGIIAEYCPSNGVVIADNNINYVTTGLNIVQSSLYIGRNTITGSTNSGTGIYLDNSNGTIEYNIVNNFQKSLLAYYSSPYLLKNTFNGASSKNIDLISNSSPVMKPVVSGSTLRWLGGNNTITGSPGCCGISFTDCYPLMDSGYNRVIVNGSDYLNGTFTFQYTTVPARLNWWYDEPPQSSLFDITGGDVTYSPTFDGSSVPATDGSELNSLGWGLYDTVFTKSLGDNPTPEDIFMQAYTKEMRSEYAAAINLYKQVVSEYRSSSYAPVSLARIFNCLEKNNSSPPVYQAVQGYYTNIHGDTTYPQESRELSEDFAIKSKVRQGLIENAIIDYDNIYSHNQNNSKGHHALINKLCLMNMAQGGDNPFGGNSSNIKHKYELLSLIIGKNIEPRTQEITQNIPRQFRLYQNYPNPFNPVTTIKYDIPKDGNVSIKIYEITGREVFSINEYKQAGSYSVVFDGTNFASGLYFYMLRSGNYVETKKMVLVK